MPLRISQLAFGVAMLAMGSAVACRRSEPIPTERAWVVKVASAPALSKADPTGHVPGTVRRGEVFRVRSKLPEFQWQGLFDGRPQERTGLAEASRRPLDRDTFVFTSDMIEADVPASAWLCSQMDKPPEACSDSLLRTVATSNALLAYVPCWQSECPVLELSNGVLTRRTMPMLSELRIVTLADRPLVLAWTHWIRSPQWTGGSVTALHVSPPLQPAGELPLFETDARTVDSPTYWFGAIEVEEAVLRLRGRRSTRDRQTGKELSGTDVDEQWVLGTDGKLTKSERPKP